MAGIKLSANFDLRAALPLDGRTTVTTVAERNAIPFAYAGMRVFVRSTLRDYLLISLPATDNANWKDDGQVQELLLPVTVNGQTEFTLPIGITVTAMVINGSYQRKTDYEQTDNTLTWLATNEFELETTDNIEITFN